MRMTSKGQVTIPIEIRRELGLHPQTEICFELDGDSVRLRKTEPRSSSRGERLVRHMLGKATIGMTTEEIMALTRGED